MPGSPDSLGDFFTAFRADDPQNDMAEGDPLFEKDADHVSPPERLFCLGP